MFPGKLKHMPTIKSVMTPFPHSIEVDQQLAAAREMMVEHGIRHLPVTDNGALVGVLSERELADEGKRFGPAADAPETKLLVGDVCSRDLFVVGLDRRLDTVLLDMAEQQIGLVLVLKEERLAGIFTTTDACRCFGEHLRALFPLPGGDLAA